MEYGGELMSRKADLLKAYLTETQNLGAAIGNINDTEEFDFDALGACMQKREDIISKLKEVDSLLSREYINSENADVEKYRWLCNELISQINDVEAENKALFMILHNQFVDLMRQNNESIRGINAYFQLDMQNPPTQEWKK